MAAVLGNNPFRINEWRVDPDLNRLSRGELTIKVDPQNMKVLELLASRPGEVFSPTQIEESAWPDVVVSPNSVYQSIAHLRRALGDDKKEPRFIETISKKGYRCVGRVEPIEVPKIVDVPTNVSAIIPGSLPIRSNWWPTAITATAACVLALGLALSVATRSPTDSTNAANAGNDPPDLTAEILLRKGDVALIAGHPHNAAREFERAVALARSSTGEESELTARAMAKLADAFLWQARFREAERLASEAVRIFETSAPPMDPRQLNARTVLGEVLINLEDYSRADVHLVKAVEIGEQLYGRSDPRVEGSISTLAKLRRAEGRLQEAEELARELLNDPLPKGYDRLARVLHRTLLATVLQDQQRHQEAIQEAQVALTEVELFASADHPYSASAHQILATNHLRIEKYEAAERHARESFRLWKLNEFEPARLAWAASTLGEVFLRQGKLSEAREQLTYAARNLQSEAAHWHRSAKRENDERIALLNEAMAKQKS